jgi:hypothetical protein
MNPRGLEAARNRPSMREAPAAIHRAGGGDRTGLAPAGRIPAELLEEIEEREGVRHRLLTAGADEAVLERLVARLRGEA